MSDSSPAPDAEALDVEKTHAVPAPPTPIHLVHENAGRLLAGMLGGVSGGVSGGVENEGDVIGPYRLCELLGEGGFGNVWHAEQTQVIKREVALKLIKPGMDSAQVLGRFNQERQALASLRHPNIAMLLDAGVGPSGRPYFAMELVHGGPITDWCRAENATLQERLRLFIQICHAVQHAHEQGILHRDIKPTNILVADVNGQPVPKVIDFGVAKALNASSLEELTLLTHADQAVGTPLYMSPEQIQGNRELDARSDVYALGVVLYELLTGSQPFDTTTAAARSVEGLKRLILDTIPERPSTRVRRRTGTQKRRPKKGFEASLSMLPADLDWITMRALEKDRQRRYPSAAEFAADVQRHLDCQPVLARPPSITYRTGRWVRRNRGVLVPACVAVALSAAAFLLSRHLAPGTGPASATTKNVQGGAPASAASPPAPQQFKFPPPRTAQELAGLTVFNSLGMKFVPVPISGGPTDKQRVLFSIWTTRVQDYRMFAEETKRQWTKPFFEQGPDHPAVNVSRDDANAFCAWLTEKERKAGSIPADQSYRLPGDREWSCAAGIHEQEDATPPFPGESGPTPQAIPTLPLPVGNYASAELGPLLSSDEPPRFRDRVGYKVRPSLRDGHATTAPVGSYPPNHLGLHDILGNVWQWIADRHFSPRADLGMIRGGSWLQPGTFALFTRRDGVSRGEGRDDYGFRVVLASDATGSAPAPRPTAPDPLPPAGAAKESVTNSLDMKFLPVPGTKVLFCIHETRNQDYAAYAAAVPGVPDDWKSIRGPFGNDYPVWHITWDNARQFCAWLSQKEGKAYRLPTDHEWSLAVGLKEKAPLTHETLHAGPLNTTHYPWNGTFPPKVSDGNYAGKEWLKLPARYHSRVQLSGCSDYFVETAPVMSFKPNPIGLYDMGGNLAEMCVFTPDAEGTRTEVLRGAYFYTQTTPENLLSSCRVWPAQPTKGSAANGFRVVMDPVPPPALSTKSE